MTNPPRGSIGARHALLGWFVRFVPSVVLPKLGRGVSALRSFWGRKPRTAAFAYVPHTLVDEYLSQGWIIADDFRDIHHGEYSVLMRKKGRLNNE